MSASVLPGTVLLAQSVSTETHEYDELGRLKSTVTAGPNATYNDGEARSYCYDELGNRVALRASQDGTVLGSATGCAGPSSQTPSPTPTPAPNPPPSTPSNNPPIANIDFLYGYCGENGLVNVTANDTDAEDATVTLVPNSIVWQAGGNASIYGQSGGLVGVTHATSATVTIFSYTIVDSAGATDTGELSVSTGSCFGGGGGGGLDT